MTDARFKTMRHIETVRNHITVVINELLSRQIWHDWSKTESPEVEAFEILTEKLRTTTYGSQEYKESLQAFQPSISHHYAHNRHHPEHFENGIQGMNLIDLIEMLSDWKSATLRHDDGDIYESLRINQQRFKYSDELQQIFLNTIDWMHEQTIPHKAEES